MCVFSLRAFRDAALVKDVILVRLGEVPNKGLSQGTRRIRRRKHVHAISSQLDGVLLKAHTKQILPSCTCLGTTQADLASHVMQIRTGEGKSIILGACSALLALLGFRVRCVCYSTRITASSRTCSRPRHREARRPQHDKEVQRGWRMDCRPGATSASLFVT